MELPAVNGVVNARQAQPRVRVERAEPRMRVAAAGVKVRPARHVAP